MSINVQKHFQVCIVLSKLIVEIRVPVNTYSVEKVPGLMSKIQNGHYFLSSFASSQGFWSSDSELAGKVGLKENTSRTNVLSLNGHCKFLISINNQAIDGVHGFVYRRNLVAATNLDILTPIQ